MSKRATAGPEEGNAVPRIRVYLAPLLVFAVALVLRGVYLVEMHHQDLFHVVMGDAASYDAWGADIAAGHWVGKGVFYQAPLYPYFLGFVYTFFTHSLTAARWIQILLGSLSCAFLFVAARRFWNRTAGFVAGFGLAVYPPAIFYDGLIQKSVLDVFLLSTLLMVLSPREKARERRVSWIAAGVTLGLLALTRENALILVGLVLLWVLFIRSGRSWRPRLRRSAYLIGGLALVLLPVGFRNLAVGGEFHLTTSQFGPNLYIGNHHGADGTYQSLRPGRGDARFERLDATQLAEQAVGRRLNPGEVSRYWADSAIGFMTGRPGEWLRLMGRKTMLLLNRVEISDTEAQEVYAEHSWILRVTGPFLNFGVLVPLAAFGIVLGWRERRRLALPLLFLLGYAGSVVLFYVFGRYRYPLTPILLIFAAVGIVEGVRLVGRRRWRRLALPAVALVAAGVLANWPLVDPAQGRAATYTNLGRVMAESGRPDASLAYYRKALAIDPDNYVVLNNLANLYYRMGHNRDALPLYVKVLKLRPDYAEAHNNYANLLLRLGKLDEAEKEYRSAVRLNPGYAEAWVNLGNLAAQRNRIDDAITCLSRALSINPRLQVAARNLQVLRAMKARGQTGPR
jgi:tetratricopeptide (TPR) repeat protein